MKKLVITALFISVAVGLSPLSGKTIADFTDPLVGTQWLSVNDGVMGGVSEGRFRVTDDQTLEFFGTLSLENRGGFTSIRSRPADLQLGDYDTVAVRVKGDGRTYNLNLRTSSRNAAGSYRAPFNTRKNTWQVVRIPFKDFTYTAYGRTLPGTGPVQAKDIQSVGFTLADKQAGPFRLEIDWIKAETAESSNEIESAEQPGNTNGEKDIVATAVDAGQFNTLIAAVKAAGLVESLKGEGPLTVFAPSDEAFAKLPQGTVESLLEPGNREALVALLSYHVLPGEILLGARSSATLQGQAVDISAGGSFKVNGANVIAFDIKASNGVIHVIDTVLMPPRVEQTDREAALRRIQDAISRGVPLFNAGQAASCTAIYKATVESLLKDYTNALSRQDQTTLQNALRQMRDDDSPQAQAWTLRRAMDSVYRSRS